MRVYKRGVLFVCVRERKRERECLCVWSCFCLSVSGCTRGLACVREGEREGEVCDMLSNGIDET